MIPWLERFKDLPVVRVKPVFTKWDGDMSLLYELADRIFLHAREDVAAVDKPQSIYNATIDATWIIPHQILRAWDRGSSYAGS